LYSIMLGWSWREETVKIKIGTYYYKQDLGN
jgi:hypothetical protein